MYRTTKYTVALLAVCAAAVFSITPALANASHTDGTASEKPSALMLTTAEELEEPATASNDIHGVNAALELRLSRTEIAQLKKTVPYPAVALRNKQEGRFDVLAFIDAQGKIAAVNFEMKGNTDPMEASSLLMAAMDAVAKYQFPSEYHNGIVRIPFLFRMY
jgi:outer membrane biosynthesis protein TonB